MHSLQFIHYHHTIIKQLNHKLSTISIKRSTKLKTKHSRNLKNKNWPNTPIRSESNAITGAEMASLFRSLSLDIDNPMHTSPINWITACTQIHISLSIYEVKSLLIADNTKNVPEIKSMCRDKTFLSLPSCNLKFLKISHSSNTTIVE